MKIDTDGNQRRSFHRFSVSMKKFFVVLAIIMGVGARPAFSQKEKDAQVKRNENHMDFSVTFKLGDRVSVVLEKPEVVALSRPGEKRWGVHQFPSLSQLPSGHILLTYSNGEDSVRAYGGVPPAFVSGDNGRTWVRMEKSGLVLPAPYGIVCRAGGGEFLCVPPARPFDLKAAGLTMPRPVGFWGKNNVLYRFEDCPKPVRDFIRYIDAWRWMPKTRSWKAEKIEYDTRRLLVWKRAGGYSAHLLPRTWFEHPPVQVGKELIYADYRTKYMQENGKADVYGSVVCMVSNDRGKTWIRRGTVAGGMPRASMAEPMIGRTSDSRLACVIRTSSGPESAPLMITFSRNAGRTWTPVEEVNPFGVFPGIVLLNNGVLVMSYGRPGVHLRFSLDGTGRSWSDPVSVVAARGKWNELSCGYTSLLVLNENEFLLAYSYFTYRAQGSGERKAILVRRVRVNTTPGI